MTSAALTLSAPPLDLSGFLTDCERRGISLSLGGNGDTLRVSGRQGTEPPPRLAEYLRHHKPALLDLLRTAEVPEEIQTPDQAAEVEQTEDTRRLQAAYEAARAGLMPSLTTETRVTISPGVTTTEPARAFLAAYANLRGVTPGLRAKEHATMNAIALWWDNQPANDGNRKPLSDCLNEGVEYV